MAAPTQNHLLIKDIQEDLLVLSDGSFALVLQTSAVNFALLSDMEQVAIIQSFGGLLNSLSFMIQIVIRSKKLDISSYLQLLDEARSKQKNPLLQQFMDNYRNFVATTIRENQVLDKQFYVVIPVSYLELGLVNNSEKNIQKAIAVLKPRKDSVVKQLARVGLKATQLTTPKLVKLFYEIYNNPELEIPTQNLQVQPDQVAMPVFSTPPDQVPSPTPQITPISQTPASPPQTIQTSPTPSLSTPTRNRSLPFVVEELQDDYGQVR